ncbi:4Fe-4S binding protein (plasmid) [Rhodobacteraceae bacterium SC52]|nr:4Fe-4S binding protein [Rhodobacteraceae bacterium SC52]
MSRFFVLFALALCAFTLPAKAELATRDQMASMIVPPFSLGEALNDKGVYQLLNSGGAEAGFVFETEQMAALPGFSGAAINMLVTLDPDGRFLDVKLLSHNEPIFVSGLGEAPFHKFFEQYRGLSISDSLVVGTPYGRGGAGSDLVYLDGVTKATASVRIAHESLMAAALQVAREKMSGIASGPPVKPNADITDVLDWDTLVADGLVGHLYMTNAEVDALFAGSVWSDDDPEATAEPDAPFIDLWLVDIGAPAIARAVLDADGFDELQRFSEISGDDEPLLVIETARHGLVSEDFVRNTAPDRLSAEQGGFPVALRDADLFVSLSRDLPRELRNGTAMILRTDRRLGFDPTQPWELHAQIVREHGMFQPEIGIRNVVLTHSTDARFYTRPEAIKPLPAWREALLNRQSDLIPLGILLIALLAVQGAALKPLARLRNFVPLRLVILGVVTVFIGWWGQGQLSIVTVLGVIRTVWEGGNFGFLLYDPFSLAVWAAAIIGFVAWGRGLFCGWLCPFGALQEFAHYIGRALRLPQIEPSALWDARLKYVKYVLLAGMIGTVFWAPNSVDKVAEIEPFKTAITTFFLREWYYVAYAAAWLLLGTVLFKGFCRYVCPLGAFMAIGGLLRGRDWIERRAECGSPCQLCKVKCNYGAIKKTGEIDYSECFQCLDCVTIFEDPKTCVPRVLEARRASRTPPAQVAAE